MGLHLHHRLDDALARARRAVFRVFQIATVAAGPAVVAPLFHHIEILRRQVVAQHIPPVVGGPERSRVWMECQPHCVAQTRGKNRLAGRPIPAGRIVDDNRGPARVFLVANIAGGADGNHHPPIGQKFDSAGVVAAGGIVVDEGCLLVGDTVTVGVAQVDDAGGHAHIPGVFVPDEAMGAIQTRGKRSDFVGHTVPIGVGEGHNPVIAPVRSVENAIWSQSQKTHVIQTLSKDRHPEAGGSGQISHTALAQHRTNINHLGHLPEQYQTTKQKQGDNAQNE